MKCHFIEQFTQPDEKISVYKTGKFLDFCRGPHIPSTGKVKAFKLLNIAGAYWLGDEKNAQLQRIYGTSFFSKKDLDEFVRQQEEAKKRDHRVLGQQLDLFSIQDLAGPGLIFWHPKGGIIRKEMEDWMRSEYLKRGYSLVYTPHVARRQLWQTSGHEGYYSQNMFDVMELDDAEYRLKPMNCPFHILIYRDALKSYRDLPVRLGELGTVYRYERSGVMHGLLRVRGFTQDDAHIFCTPEQIESEIEGCLDFALDVLKDFGFTDFVTELSTWNPDDRKNFVGSEEQWNLATRSLENVLERRKIDYKIIPGEAAFYGPKIDIKLVDAIGRLWQLSTIQFDFNLPQRFNLEYVAEDGSRRQPLMVHRALYGSVERFFGVLIEHYAGAFPVWLSPVQAVMIPISERHADVRQPGGRPIESSWGAGRGRCPQREDERQNPRARHAESPVSAGGGRQGIGSRQSQRPHPRKGKNRGHAGGGVRRKDQEIDRREGCEPVRVGRPLRLPAHDSAGGPSPRREWWPRKSAQVRRRPSGFVGRLLRPVHPGARSCGLTWGGRRWSPLDFRPQSDNLPAVCLRGGSAP